MFADLGPRCRGHKHGTGGDVERVGAVAAGAHDVHQVPLVGHLHLGGELAHHLSGRRDLANGFLLDAQPRDQSRHQHRRHTARRRRRGEAFSPRPSS
ncbi:hypothetical protein SDC9_118017 [bioreactor metagenome]|uniref:Uncharacterized protein n=1 Tax=bioreactor metagenome TaxID=1076179 RepID=A0A645C8P5_9ZZZZ